MTLPRPPERAGLVVRSDLDVVIADATLSEQYRDSVSATEERVEDGAPVSDHARQESTAYSCTVVFTDTPLGQQGSEGRALSEYETLLLMMRSFALCRVTTGRRTLRNMLITKCEMGEAPPAKEALEVDLEFKEIRRASRQVVLLPAEVSRDPDRTTGQAEQGNQNAPTAGAAEGASAAHSVYISQLYRLGLSPDAQAALAQTSVGTSPSVIEGNILGDLFSGGLPPGSLVP